jgi:hypothetical protein
VLRHELIVLKRRLPRPAHKQRSLVFYPAVSLVSINPAGSHNYPARNTDALAQGRLSLLLALEAAPAAQALV